MDIIAYTRISLDSSGEKLGVERQEKEIRAWAELNGHTIIEVFQDNDISATSGKARPSFNKALQHECPNIIVWHLDRLVRVTRDLEKVLDAGKTVYQVTANDLNLTTATGRALARTIVAWATAEVERKAERHRSKNRQSAEAGKHYWNKGNRPFGHNLDGSLHETEAPALQAIIQRIMDGASIADACRELNTLGHTPVAGGNRTKEWTVSALGQILRNKRICAVRVYKGEETQGAWEPLISPATFEALQLNLKTRTKTRIGLKRENLLSSLALCGICLDAGITGRTMGQSQYTSSAGTIATYRCSIGKHCTKRADYADDYVRDETLMALAMPEVLSSLGVETEKLEHLRTEHHKESQRWEDWQNEAAEEGLRPSEYRKPRQLHEQKIAELNRHILAAEQSSVLGEDFGWGNLLGKTTEERAELWSSIPLEKRKLFVTTVWESVVIHPSPRGKTGFDPKTVVLTAREAIAPHLTDANKHRHLTEQLMKELGFTQMFIE
ncbi:recombinase family protein [Glutamicibacter sp. 287]|uniref:recombinase family protein n=1 Tax=Glutamicibacter sp. 287 TaxID=3457732 RepID=UPI0040345D1D